MSLRWIGIALALGAACGGCSVAARQGSYRGRSGGYAVATVADTGLAYGVSGGSAGGDGGGGVGEGASVEAPAPPAEPSSSHDFDDDRIEGELERRAPTRYAQARPRETAATTTGSGTTPPGPATEQAQATATDAVDTSGPLLVYTATFHLAVYEVRESQQRIVGAARELGGFVFAQSDDRIVVRVPAPRFHAMIEHVEQGGDVEHRDVQAQDVGEEFHDVEIRIRNLEAMRARVEALLASARSVEEALQVEQQLQRITSELERMRGRQRFLADRIAFSTITVLFRARPREALDQPEIFELPFAWLDELGLPNLLDLRR